MHQSYGFLNAAGFSCPSPPHFKQTSLLRAISEALAASQVLLLIDQGICRLIQSIRQDKTSSISEAAMTTIQSFSPRDDLPTPPFLVPVFHHFFSFSSLENRHTPTPLPLCDPIFWPSYRPKTHRINGL
jgi:hypothetical protein